MNSLMASFPISYLITNVADPNIFADCVIFNVQSCDYPYVHRYCAEYLEKFECAENDREHIYKKREVDILGKGI